MGEQRHQSDPRILNRRTLKRDHRRLAELLRGGLAVLDVGCGTGAITADIAKVVGPSGMVVGIDRDAANLAIARENHSGIAHLTFESGDILSLDARPDFAHRFDIVTAARTLQWISDIGRAVRNMKKAAKLGGRIIALDYNLEDTRWEPEPPASFRNFYAAFLTWRAANRWDNRMADHLPALFQSAGVAEIEIHSCDEITQRGDPDFFDAYSSGIWLYVIQTLGPRLADAGVLPEAERRRAETEYDQYLRATLRRQIHSLSAVEGKVVD